MEHTNGWTFVGIMGSVNGTIQSQTLERWFSWSVSLDWSFSRVGCDWLIRACWSVECVIKTKKVTDGSVSVDWLGDGWGVIDWLIWGLLMECVFFFLLMGGPQSIDQLMGWVWLIDWLIWGLLIDGLMECFICLMGMFQLIDQLMGRVWLIDMGIVDWWSVSFVWWECFSQLISWWVGWG